MICAPPPPRPESCYSQNQDFASFLKAKTLDTDFIRREAINYLGSMPKELHEMGSESVAQLAIQLGNFFIWLSHRAEQGPQPETPIDQTAMTLATLGKQFRVVGLELWEHPKNGTLQSRIERLEKMVSQTLSVPPPPPPAPPRPATPRPLDPKGTGMPPMAANMMDFYGRDEQ